LGDLAAKLSLAERFIVADNGNIKKVKIANHYSILL
jgi:hypothetical protein